MTTEPLASGNPAPLRAQILAIIDQACWSARKMGHDDYGLDYGVDPATGVCGFDESNYDLVHAAAWDAVDKVLALVEGES